MAASDLETRLLALEKQIAPLAAANTPKISTKVAGALTAVVTALTYVLSSGFLSSNETAAVTVIVGGITAYLAAEET